jgi:hypothetical protein
MAESREEYLKRINSTKLPAQPMQKSVFGGTPKYKTVPKPDGVPTCTCGSNQFKAKRKTSTKALFGVASLAGKAQHIECVVCGALYKRG